MGKIKNIGYYVFLYFILMTLMKGRCRSVDDLKEQKDQEDTDDKIDFNIDELEDNNNPTEEELVESVNQTDMKDLRKKLKELVSMRTTPSPMDDPEKGDEEIEATEKSDEENSAESGDGDEHTTTESHVLPISRGSPQRINNSNPSNGFSRPKTPGTWTLSCPSPCSQNCSPSCTPQCCMDNFAMAPPVPENTQSMYLCPSYCTTSSCSNSCPAYCCAMPMIKQGMQPPQNNPTCPSYCASSYSQFCPSTCPQSCCTGEASPISVTAQYGYPPDVSYLLSQAADSMCSPFCSDYSTCISNPVCPISCCKN